MSEEPNTLRRIHEAGTEEFLRKGFQKASLRNIVKAAGVTTGAFYGYYKSKEQLFCALVAPAGRFMQEFKRVQNDFVLLSPEDQQKYLGNISASWLLEMTDMVYDNAAAFRLALTCAEGTQYAGYMDELVCVKVNATHTFINMLRSQGKDIPDIDIDLEHLIVSGMFASYFEPILHDLPRSKAKNYVCQLYRFHAAGWSELMGVPHIAGKDPFLGMI